jgi:YidC/Oxa1 family membrane protein insertase
MEDRQSRLLLVIIMTFITWYFVSYFFNPPKKVEPKPKKNTTEKIETEKKESLVKKEPGQTKPVIPLVETKDVQKFYIKTASFLVEFSSLGGRIEHFYLKDYKDMDGKPVKVAKLDKEITFDRQSYKAIELSRGMGFDFNLITSKEEIPSSLYNQVNFSSNYNESSKKLVFEAKSIDGKFIIRKTYTFFTDENFFAFTLELVNPNTEAVLISSSNSPYYFRSFGSLGPASHDEMDDRHAMHYFRYYYMDGFKDSIDSKSDEGFFSSFFGSDEGKDKRFAIFTNMNEGTDFLGVGSRYFVAALDPLDHKPNSILLDYRNGNTTGVLTVMDNLALKPNETLTFKHAAYVGIREADGMAFRNKENYPSAPDSPFVGLSDKLEKSFNQGITTPFRNAIVWFLKKTYIVIPNYGWCIIAFAILFKVVFYPLNKKQAESMKKMQELKPQIDAINEKYASDPQVKQQKILELYKQNNANPMGGCLPMVIQIPIFIALYTAFSDTIDLWREPFLWVKDLSEPDTVHKLSLLGMHLSINILPLIMVGTQVVQTMMTSVSSDPNQKMMMYMMPLIMLYFFWTMPAGVTLYWTIQNVLSILQQYYTNNFATPSMNSVKTIVRTEVEIPADEIKKFQPKPQKPKYRNK